MKTVLIVCDGMGDRPTKALNGLTPLQAADAYTFNKIASLGECGIMDVIAPGQPPGSDTAHLAIFGYDPYTQYSGRGAYEALGAGLDLKPGEVAFRCNFATVSDEGIIIDRRAGRITTEEARILAEALKDIKLEDAESIFVSTTEHRGVLVLRGDKLSRMVSDVDVHEVGVKIGKPKPLDGSIEAEHTAKVLEEFITKARKILEEHPLNKERIAKGLRPANAVLPRGAGTLPNVKPISGIWNIKAAAIAGGALYKGIAKALGFDLINVPGATGTVNTNLKAKIQYTIDALKKYDLVFLHIKATDTVSHDKNPVKKKEVIEWISHEITPLVDLIESQGYYLALTADHTTPSEIGEHRGDPVPLAIMGPNVRRDWIEKFDELSCARGSICRIKGVDLMKILMNYLDKVPLFGE
ncbi:MAG: 2,3-bisphosphoglycerate-independent phosphoglycerate mutase [Thaumarchaeota archaeon]|jgi:2,3-bisphosphoglycerate-independent phosphoglycerate mutase|nr:2,3-bisphosphoglycerate-independent phosphoglycerate mutase [Candidatus Geocrenenecus arthurdayi]